MNNLFSGDTRRRPQVNLSGAWSREQQPEDLIKRAREQREGREMQRLRDRAGARIFAFCKGRSEAAKVRQGYRAQFDSLMATSGSDSASVLLASRLLANLFVDRNSGDVKRAATWARAVLVPPAGALDKTPLLFSLFGESTRQTWTVLIRQICYIIFSQATLHPSLTQAPLFLEITKICCDPASYIKWKVAKLQGETILQYLLNRDLYKHIRSMLVSIPSTKRDHPAIPAAIALTLYPIKAFPPAPPPSSKSIPSVDPPPEATFALTRLLSDILTIPRLAFRIPLSSVTLLASMPVEALLLHSASVGFGTSLRTILAHPDDSVTLLANILTFTNARIGKFTSGKVLSAYLDLLRTLLDTVPKAWLSEKREIKTASDVKGKGKEQDVEMIIIDDSDSENEGSGNVSPDRDSKLDLSASNPDSTSSPIDLKTRQALSILSKRDHLLSILALSTRFAGTSRPSLAGFFVSLIYSIPSKRDEIVNHVMYGPSTSSSPTTAAAERGGGLLREIWRGYIRGGPLGKLLSDSEERRGTLMAALSSPDLAREWPLLILLTELYSRCLLTLGDDEFYGAKNPLTLDEVIGLSGYLRTLTFTLYWNEGAGGIGGQSEGKVGGTRMSVDQLRTLATTLLQQIHARDSRRSFTPEGHWLMTSRFDLASFIQTVVFEDEKLDAEEEEDTRQAGLSRSDDEDEEEPQARRTLPSAKSALISKRQLAFMSPRLGVLNNIPFVIPFETRVAIFRQFIDNDRKRLGIQQHVYDRRQRQKAIVRRNHLSEDSYAHLNGLGAALKSRIEIVFIDPHGIEESGIDGGGLFKELLTSLSKEMFDTDRGLWLATSEQELYPNPHSYARDPAQLQWYKFIGRILGKALYEGILVDVRFASFFLAKWLGKQSFLDDLASLDPELYKGLLSLKNYTGDVEADYQLNFTMTDDDFGLLRTVELIRNGTETPVTNENRLQYIVLASHYRLNGQIAKQCEAFFGGLSEIIPPRFLRLFNQSELRMLVGGVDSSIDLVDLKANTVYGGWPGDEANETVRAFWETVEEFDSEERCKLIKFVTSCARPPLLGFSQLNPRFAIRNAGSDQTRLPTSSTCVNLLKLPEYSDKENLKSKLRYAINSGAGFDLS